ncbi:MAG: cobalamin biosynthesis protein CbiD [Fibrobacter sp.]|nr:cobalamin biosynthesis protein CbiD [Fibrobacter sp.]
MIGYTTGTCATAASFLAATRLIGKPHRSSIPVRLPGGEDIDIPVLDSGIDDNAAWATVRKHSGDDPDITDKAIIRADVSKSGNPGVTFFAGTGVGTVTRDGLQIPPGQAAINPVPRKMISDHLLALANGWNVTISVENGEELARQTFNPRLGIIGGISIIGTTGIVRPFSHESQLCAIRCEIGVARAARLDRIVLVPGHYGERSARMHYRYTEEPGVIEVGNDWGFALDLLNNEPLESILVVGHAGKLAKLAQQEWDTHSSRSLSALPWIMTEWECGRFTVSETFTTVEGFYLFTKTISGYNDFWTGIAEKIAAAIQHKVSTCRVAVSLCDMQGSIIAESSGVDQWK